MLIWYSTSSSKNSSENLYSSLSYSSGVSIFESQAAHTYPNFWWPPSPLPPPPLPNGMAIHLGRQVRCSVSQLWLIIRRFLSQTKHTFGLHPSAIVQVQLKVKFDFLTLFFIKNIISCTTILTSGAAWNSTWSLS